MNLNNRNEILGELKRITAGKNKRTEVIRIHHLLQKILKTKKKYHAPTIDIETLSNRFKILCLKAPPFDKLKDDI